MKRDPILFWGGYIWMVPTAIVAPWLIAGALGGSVSLAGTSIGAAGVIVVLYSTARHLAMLRRSTDYACRKE